MITTNFDYLTKQATESVLAFKLLGKEKKNEREKIMILLHYSIISMGFYCFLLDSYNNSYSTQTQWRIFRNKRLMV